MSEIDKDDAKVAALQAFEKWSNYLLVTTVAAAGWTASKNVAFNSGNIRSAAFWSFGIAIVFGIFALALVPLVAQTMSSERSIYHVRVQFRIFGRLYRAYLTQACRPQHAFFITGIMLYCLGTSEDLWIGAVVVALALAYGYLSKPKYAVLGRGSSIAQLDQ